MCHGESPRKPVTIYRFTVQQQPSASHPLKLPQLSEATVLLGTVTQTPEQKEAIAQKANSVQEKGCLEETSPPTTITEAWRA